MFPTLQLPNFWLFQRSNIYKNWNFCPSKLAISYNYKTSKVGNTAGLLRTFLWLLEHNCFIILYLCLLKSFWCNFVRFSDPKTQLFVFCQLLFISLPFLLTFNLYVVVDSYVKRMPYFSSVANYSELQKSATLCRNVKFIKNS